MRLSSFAKLNFCVASLFACCLFSSYSTASVIQSEKYACNETAKWQREDGSLESCSCATMKEHVILCPCESHKDAVRACARHVSVQQALVFECLPYETAARECELRRANGTTSDLRTGSNATLPSGEVIANTVTKIYDNESSSLYLAASTATPSVSSLGKTDEEMVDQEMSEGTIVWIAIGFTLFVIVSIACAVWVRLTHVHDPAHPSSDVEGGTNYETSCAMLSRGPAVCLRTVADKSSKAVEPLIASPPRS